MLNKAILMGRLTRDPELRHTQSNMAVCSFSLAIDRGRKDQNGERQTDFIDCVAWGRQAEFVAQWFTKGSMAIVVGREASESAAIIHSKRAGQPQQPVCSFYCTDHVCLKYFSHVDLKICALPCSHRLNFCSGTPSCVAYAFCVKPSRWRMALICAP